MPRKTAFGEPVKKVKRPDDEYTVPWYKRKRKDKGYQSDAIDELYGDGTGTWERGTGVPAE